MRLRDTLILLLCIIMAAAFLIAAGSQLDFINAQRKDMKLIINEPLKNAPPSLAFATVAMGAFRGLVVDILWIRADRLKQEGQFFDAKQLAEWITILQPRFPSVWEFQAWNMAYNISVAIPASQPQERWKWVKNGYELLRDQGIPLNPKSILLYRELAMTFQHKISDITDDAHKYYKLQLAMEMEPLLGSTDNEYFQKLAEVPTQWSQITADANVVRFIEALKSADAIFQDDEQFPGRYLSLRQNPQRFAPEAFNVIDDFRNTETLGKFDLFARAYQLRKIWKLDPVLINQLNQVYGPLDWDDPNKHLPLNWKHPDTHAIYWAVKGLQVAGKEEYSVNETNTDRIVNHSLQSLFRRGKIFIYDTPVQVQPDPSVPPIQKNLKSIFLRPDLRMFETYNHAVLATLEKYEKINKMSHRSLQIGHRNMLKNAILSFYQAGHIRQSQQIFKQLKELYPRKEFEVPLLTFVRMRLVEELDQIGLKDAKESIMLLLRESYFRYAVHDDEEAAGREKMAKEVYQHYKNEYPSPEELKRIGLPDFKLLRYLAMGDFLGDSQYPANLRRNLLGRIKVEKPDLFEKLVRQEEILLKQQKLQEQQSENN
ncbi:hypothetical protein ACFL3G_05920 [Planctomycetota bacterium]